MYVLKLNILTQLLTSNLESAFVLLAKKSRLTDWPYINFRLSCTSNHLGSVTICCKQPLSAPTVRISVENGCQKLPSTSNLKIKINKIYCISCFFMESRGCYLNRYLAVLTCCPMLTYCKCYRAKSRFTASLHLV